MKTNVSFLLLAFLCLIFKSSILPGQKPELILPLGHSDNVRYASYSPDGKRIATASNDRTVKIWNVESGNLLFTLEGFTDFTRVSTVNFSPDGKCIMTISEDGTIKIWDSNNGKLLQSPNDWTNGTKSAKYSPDGKYILFVPAQENTVINRWDVQSGKLLHVLEGHSDEVVYFIFSPDGKTILTSSEDGTAKIWDARSGEMIRSLEDKSGNSVIMGASFSPDGKSILTFTEQDFTIWDAESGNLLFTKDNTGSSPCYSPDSKKVLAVANLELRGGVWKEISAVSFGEESESRSVAGLYDATTGKLIRAYTDAAKSLNKVVENDEHIYSPVFSPDGKNIITVAKQNDNDTAKFRIFDTESGNLLLTIEGKYDDLSSVCYSPDSKRIFIVTRTSAGLYDATSGRLLRAYDAPMFRVYGGYRFKNYIPTAGFNPNGKNIFTISENNNSVKIWDVQNGALRRDLTGHTTPVFEAVFSSDSRNMLTKSFYNSSTAKIWDLVNGKILQCFEGTEWGSARYCDNDKNIQTSVMSGSGNTTIKTWNALSGKLLDAVKWNIDSLSGYIFSPDNNTLVVIDTNYNAKILNAKTGAELHKLDGPVGDAKYSPDGKSIATTSWFDFVNIWDVESGRLIHTLRGQEVKGKGNTLELGIADVNTGENISVVITPGTPFDSLSHTFKMMVKGMVKKVDFSPDGKTLINAGDRSDVTNIWDVQSGALLNNISGNRSAINPDGTRIITFDFGDIYTVPKIWDARSGKLLYTLEADPFQTCIASFSPDGKNILTANHDSVKIWDAQNGRLKRAIYFSGVLCDVDWKSERMIIHDNSELVFFNTGTGEEQFSFIAIDSSDYLVLTPDKYYMCSKNAANKLSWRIGNQLYSFDQFDLQYNRPDIVLEHLGNPDSVLIKMYRNAYEKRLKKTGFNEKMFSPEWHTPEMKILNSSTLNNTTDQSALQLTICGTDSRYKLNRLLVWINGVPMYGANGLSLLEEKTDSVVKTITISLSTGDNNIKVSCMNEKGVESLKESVDIIFNPQKPVKPDLYIIAMSVSGYEDKRFDLQYAAKDGKDIADMFDSLAISKGEYGHIIIDTLFNGKATKKNFFNLKKKLKSSNVDDQVIVFVSGHGLLNKEMDFYFATYDIDFQHPEKRGISYDDLESILDGIPARKKLLMMDACHSGEVDKEEINDLVSLNTESTPDIAFRGNVREYNFKGVNATITQSGISLGNSFELMQELFAGLDQGTGTTVISAAAGKGYALESPQWNNGVFTYSIINGLKNKAADKNRDGIITISELKDYSIKQVQLLTGGKQKPTARRESINYDWKIW